jgi:hypothetical protein
MTFAKCRARAQKGGTQARNKKEQNKNEQNPAYSS